MSNDDLFGAPAGWYPDPLGLPQLRWWNNHAWTEQTSAARQPMIVQETKFAWADEDRPTRREERERERGRGESSPTEPGVPTADALRELEPPRAYTQVSQGVPSAPAAPPSVAPEPRFEAPIPAPAAAAPAAPTAPQPVVTPQTQPVAQAAPTVVPPSVVPPAAAAPVVESLYQPDPIVPAPPVSTPSLDDVFNAPRTSMPAESLDALFGAKETRRTQTRVVTPIVTLEQVAPVLTATAKPSGNSFAAWAISVLPLVQMFITILLLNALGQAGSQFIYIGILVLPYFIVVALAYLDHKQLTANGIAKPAHWGWAFFTAPAYLVMRVRTVVRETGHGFGPLLNWFALGFLYLASVVAVPGVIISLVPQVFASQIEQAVESDALLITGSQPDVACPVSPPVLPGEQIKCISTSLEGKTSTVTVALVRSNGWIDWQTINWGGPDMGIATLPATTNP